MAESSWEMTPDNYPSIAEEGLAPVELEAVEYWRRFLPLTVAALEKQGPVALWTAIRAGWWRMEYNAQLLQLRSPELPRTMALAQTREELFPPPEPHANPDRNL